MLHHGAGVGGAGHGDHGNFSIVAGHYGSTNRIGVNGVDDEQIHTAGDEVLYLGGLGFGIVLRIQYHQFHAQLGSLDLSRILHGYEEGIFQGGYGKADGVGFGFGACQRGQQSQRESHKGYHHFTEHVCSLLFIYLSCSV